MNREKKCGHLAMLVATVLVATSFLVGAAITLGLDSLVLTFLRFLLAPLLFAPIVAWRHGIAWPTLRMTFWTLVTGSLWLLVLAAPRLTEVPWSAVPAQTWSGIVYLAIFTTLITYFVIQWSTRVIGPTKVMSYTYLNPALVLEIGLAAGQTVPTATWPGLVLALTAVLVLHFSRTGFRQTS